MTDSRDLVRQVVRGERPLVGLKTAGVSLRFKRIDQRSREVTVKPRYDASLVVVPTAVDVAKGLLSHQDHPKELKEWGLFVLGADLIDLEPLEAHPDGDLILNAVWDAGFEGRVSDESAHAARRLAGQDQ